MPSTTHVVRGGLYGLLRFFSRLRFAPGGPERAASQSALGAYPVGDAQGQLLRLVLQVPPAVPVGVVAHPVHQDAVAQRPREDRQRPVVAAVVPDDPAFGALADGPAVSVPAVVRPGHPHAGREQLLPRPAPAGPRRPRGPVPAEHVLAVESMPPLPRRFQYGPSAAHGWSRGLPLLRPLLSYSTATRCRGHRGSTYPVPAPSRPGRTVPGQERLVALPGRLLDDRGEQAVPGVGVAELLPGADCGFDASARPHQFVARDGVVVVAEPLDQARCVREQLLDGDVALVLGHGPRNRLIRSLTRSLPITSSFRIAAAVNCFVTDMTS